jgi:ADP-heptose:LPS heptosyltransferase/tetratricopeptide (TPR) repeat protein
MFRLFQMRRGQAKIAFARLLQSADKARDSRDWVRAAHLYAKAANLRPARKDLYVQAGNMNKEAGSSQPALDWYRRALDGTSADADVYLQLGHLFKTTGNLGAARACYVHAGDLGDTRTNADLAGIADIARGNSKALLDALVLHTGVESAADDYAIRALVADFACACYKTAGPDVMAEMVHSLAPALRETNEARALHRVIGLYTSLRGARASIDRSVPAPSGSLRGSASDSALIHRLIALIPGKPQRARIVDHVTRRKLSSPDFEVLDESTASATIAWIDKRAGAIERFHQHAYSSPGVTLPASLISDFLDVVNGARGELVVVDARDPQTLARLHLLRLAVALLDQLLAELRSLRYGGWPIEEIYSATMQPGSDSLDLRPCMAEHNHAEMERLRWTFETHPDHDLEREKIRAVSDLVISTLLRRRVGFTTTTDEIVALLDGQSPNVVLAVLDEWLDVGARSEGELCFCGSRLREAGMWEHALEVFRKLYVRKKDGSIGVLIDLAITEKTCGNFEEAVAYFKKACEIESDSDFAFAEYARLLPEVKAGAAIRSALLEVAPLERFRAILGVQQVSDLIGDSASEARPIAGVRQAIVPALAASVRGMRTPPKVERERIDVLQLGSGEMMTSQGSYPRCSGVSACRARIWSGNPIAACRLRIGGKTINRTEVSQPEFGTDEQGRLLYGYLFNIWFDTDNMHAFGIQTMELYFEEQSSGYRAHRLKIFVEPGAQHASGERAVGQATSASPTKVERAARAAFSGPYRQIVFVRPDQLGDAVSSADGVLRLRSLFPDARITGIVSRANAAFFRSLGVVDEFIEIDYPYSESARRRTLDTATQAQLWDVFAERAVDVAIDLSPGADSRPILRLVQARQTVGFSPSLHPWLNLGLELKTHTIEESRQALSQPRLICALVELLAIAVTEKAPKRAVSGERVAALQPLGLNAGEYVTLHSGARTESRKWPLANYFDVARRLIDERDLTVVFFVDAEDVEAALEFERAMGSRFVLARNLPSFDAFDQIVASSAVFVGNDSGPKHLAAYRGVYTVSLHMGAVSWREWGQEANGVILTRSLPCVGCGIELTKDCGRNLQCLVEIKPDEVIKEVYARLDSRVERVDAASLPSV